MYMYMHVHRVISIVYMYMYMYAGFHLGFSSRGGKYDNHRVKGGKGCTSVFYQSE